MDEEISEEGRHFVIARDYLRGTIARPKDPEQALFHMLKAAEGGHYLAMLTVFHFYLTGEVVQQDLNVARAWAMKLKERTPESGCMYRPDEFLESVEAKEKELASGGRSQPQPKDRDVDAVEARAAKTESATAWKPILALAIIFVLVYVAQGLENESPGASRKLIGGLAALGAAAIFLNIIWEGSLKATLRNFVGFVRGLALTILVLVAVGLVARCVGMGVSSDAPAGGGLFENSRSL